MKNVHSTEILSNFEDRCIHLAGVIGGEYGALKSVVDHWSHMPNETLLRWVTESMERLKDGLRETKE